MGQKSMYPAIQISTRKVDIATITSNKKKKKNHRLAEEIYLLLRFSRLFVEQVLMIL
jgi:hypothetical protein